MLELLPLKLLLTVSVISPDMRVVGWCEGAG